MGQRSSQEKTMSRRRDIQAKKNDANMQLLNKNCIAHWVRERVEEDKMDFQKGASFKPVKMECSGSEISEKVGFPDPPFPRGG